MPYSIVSVLPWFPRTRGDRPEDLKVYPLEEIGSPVHAGIDR